LNWKPKSHYSRDRFGVDSLIVIETIALAMIALAAVWIEFLT
jgi:hypothetical protein